MKTLVYTFGMALLVSAVATPLVKRLAFALGAVDGPSARRVHRNSIPRLGGVAVIAGFFAPIVALFFVDSQVGQTLTAQPGQVLGLVTGSAILAILGTIDDVRGVRALYKLYGQIAAASCAFIGGFRIDGVSLPWVGDLSMGIFAGPVSVFWIVAIINAINLVDGLDGLAGGVAFFACVTNFVVATLYGNNSVLLLSAALAGAILGFLLYNFNPATIFMGDSGSMFLGFVLALTSLMGSSIKSSTTVAILVPIIALGLPIVDTLFAMVRRFLERRPIFSPDRGHIHHRLLDLGITHRKAVLILYALSVTFTVIAIAVSLGRSWQVGASLTLLSAVLIGIVRFVGYFEYLHLRRRQSARIHTPLVERLRRQVPELIRQLADAPYPSTVRDVLTRLAHDAKLEQVELEGATEEVVLPLTYARTTQSSSRHAELVKVTYPLPRLGASVKLRFFWESPEGDVSPQADMLLQLIADQVESVIADAKERHTRRSSYPAPAPASSKRRAAA